MSGEHRVLPTREGYDLWAATYDTMGNWMLALEQPEVDRAFGDVRDRELLDVGAGTGRHAIRLAAAGARVTAVDFSDEMLAKARAKPGTEGIRFVSHDVLRPLPFADRSFDRVLSAMVLEHLPVSELASFFRELARVARADGLIVVTAMHPSMFLRGRSASFRDESGNDIRPRSYQATLSDYVMGAVDARLEIRALLERAVDEALVARFPRAAQSLGWPALFVMELRPR